MLVKRKKRKIPRNAVEPLMQTCKLLSEEWGKPAAEIFKDFLELMNKYADYFFSKPWPEKYDYDEATSFTDEDVEFLSGGEKEEFDDRFKIVLLKKNMYLKGGFMGYFGMFWTWQAFHEKFVRPGYKSVLEAFGSLSQEDEDARSVLNNLKEQFSIELIHESLVDLLEHERQDESTRKLIGEIFELLHESEGLPSCENPLCDWYWRQKYSSSASYS